DTIGGFLGGTTPPVTRIVAEVVAEDACRPLASQLGTGFKISPENAALLNGVSGHALEFDDVSGWVGGNPSVDILPAALATAELVGASGSELIEAYVIGVEVMSKLGLAIGPAHYQAGWHATSTLGTLGAAVAAGRLLGLDADSLQMAIAIAVSEASGSRQNFGTMTKPFHAGHAARCGVHADRPAGEVLHELRHGGGGPRRRDRAPDLQRRHGPASRGPKARGTGRGPRGPAGRGRAQPLRRRPRPGRGQAAGRVGGGPPRRA